VPREFTRACVKRDDRGGVQIVSAATQCGIPGGRIAGSEIQQVQSGIVGDRIPDSSTATDFPAFAAQGFGGGLHGLGFKAARGISGNGVETPSQLAGFGVVRGDASAYPIFGAGVANDDAARDDAWRSRDGVSLGNIDGVQGPDGSASAFVDGDQFAVKRGDVNFVANKATPRFTASQQKNVARSRWTCRS